MPSPNEIYNAVVRVLEQETLPDPDPTSSVGADARLSSIATINPDIHDPSGRNRSHQFPGIDITLDRKVRLDSGDATGEWTGEFEFDDDGHLLGRIFSKLWEVRILFNIVMWSGDEKNTITGLSDDLESVLSRFDTKLRGDFLRREDGTALQIRSFIDQGGQMGRGSSSLREYEHEVTVEFEQLINENEYGPTPTVENVLVPLPGEHHGDPTTSEDEILGDVTQERIDREPLVESVASGETLSIPEGSTEYVTTTFAHDGSIDHDGTLEFLE
jgi:hypothetical protein